MRWWGEGEVEGGRRAENLFSFFFLFFFFPDRVWARDFDEFDLVSFFFWGLGDMTKAVKGEDLNFPSSPSSSSSSSSFPCWQTTFRVPSRSQEQSLVGKRSRS